MEERSLIIRVLMAHFSVKIYLYTHFLLSGRLLMLFEPALRPDPLIWTWLGKKMPSSGCLDKFLKSEGTPGPIWTNWAQRYPDKNLIFGIRPFLLLPGVLASMASKQHGQHVNPRGIMFCQLNSQRSW